MEEYYHIHKSNKWDPLWKEGNTLLFGKETNNEFMSFYDDDFKPGFRINADICSPVFAANKMLELTQMLSQQDYVNFVDFAKHVFIDTSMYIRERIFEEERVKISNNYPSRYSCLWVCQKSMVTYWYKMLGNSGIIVKLSVDGITRKCDQEYLYREILSLNQIRNNAIKYWNSSDTGKIENEEILFEGNVNIQKIFDSISEFEKDN